MEGGVYFLFLGLLLLVGEDNVGGELLLEDEGGGGGLGLVDLFGESPLLPPPKFKRMDVPPLDPLGAGGLGGDLLGALLGDLGRGGEGGMVKENVPSIWKLNPGL